MKSPHFRARIAALVLLLVLGACSGESEQSLLASGRKYLEQDNPRAATIQFKNVLQKNPRSAEARYLLGRALLEREEPVAASVELRKAQDLKYSPDDVTPALARALLMLGQSKKVVDAFGVASLGRPDAMADLQTTLAGAFLQQGRRAEAESALARALQAAPEYVPARVLKARMLAGSGDTQGALALADDIIKRSPKSSEAWLLQGDLLLYTRAEQARVIDAYRHALAARKDNLAAHAALIGLYAASKNLTEAQAQLDALRKVRPDHPQTRFFEVQLAFQRGDLKTAAAGAQQLLKWGGDNARVLQLAGAVAAQTGSLLQAESYLNKALQIDPDMTGARVVLANVYVRSGRALRALDTLRPLLDDKDPSAEVLALAGTARLQSGDRAQAETLYRRAIEKDPKDGASRTALAMLRFGGEGGEAGIGELESIAHSDAGTSADIALVVANLRKNDPDAALKAVDGLEKKQPGKPLASNLRGSIYLLRGDVTGARRSFERALEIEPTNFQAVNSLAVIDAKENHLDAAEQRFDALLKLEPENVPALLAKARLSVDRGQGKEVVLALIDKAIRANPVAPDPRLMAVNYRLRIGDGKGALGAARDAVGALPDSPELLEALARSLLATGEVNQAIASYGKLVSVNPKYLNAYLGLADAYVAAGNSRDALQSIKQALALAPGLLPVQRRAVMLHLAAGQSAEALQLARAVQAQRPKAAVGFVLEGDVQAAKQNWDGAAAAYRRALQIEPVSDGAEKLYVALVRGGKTPQAGDLATQWIRDHPKDAGFLYFLGSVALKEKDYATAETNLLRVVELQPSNAAALNNLAWAKHKLGKADALGYVERADKLNPEQPAFADTLAAIHASLGHYDRAIELEQKAVQLQPQNNEFRLSLAKMYLKAGKKALAKKELEQLAQLGDKFPAQREVASLRSQL